MSQKKVDQYKEYKKNKDKILKQEKRRIRVQYAVMIALAALLCVWLVFSAVTSVQKAKAAEAEAAGTETVEVDMNAYSDFLAGLQNSFTAE